MRSKNKDDLYLYCKFCGKQNLVGYWDHELEWYIYYEFICKSCGGSLKDIESPKKKSLVIGKKKEIQSKYEGLLKRSGFNCDTATTKEEALAKVEFNYDLIIVETNFLIRTLNNMISTFMEKATQFSSYIVGIAPVLNRQLKEVCLSNGFNALYENPGDEIRLEIILEKALYDKELLEKGD